MSDYGVPELATRVCQHHGEQPLSAYNKAGKNADGSTRYRCKQCMAASHRKHYEKHKKKVNAKAKEYRQNNKDKVAKWKAQYQKKLSVRRWEAIKAFQLMDREDIEKALDRKMLKDWYVRELLAKRSALKAKEFPQKLVELKRAQLMLRRAKYATSIGISINEVLEDDKKCEKDKTDK